MGIPGIRNKMLRSAESIMNMDGPNVVSATLHWTEATGLPGNVDHNDESQLAGGDTEQKSLPFRTFFHQIDHRLSTFQRFAEVQTGDVILDYLTDLQLNGKGPARIEINGIFYVQKNASQGLLEAWDVQQGNGGLFRTLVLTPAS